ncbi:TlpA family protein disulfide reductase [Rhizosphaericola mali]|uniref:TlpA family protein disulfide reductase n=1 Tax=Rhizosphaericola mali TaxID=2545455 RepID=A0A5P2G2M6_9BACT|nr:TlpA disulfide reductase family protein [Rhizosphaericola mali]QES88359.1 TlpA family protein disulfide reductase [Rhizosphaericola mali]
MKKKATIFLSSLLAGTTLMAQEQDSPRFKTKETLVVAGSELPFTYIIPSTIDKTNKSNHLKMFVFDTTYHWFSQNIIGKKVNDSTINGAIKVPLNAGAMFFAFADSIGNILDNNNDDGYFAWVKTPIGTRAAGAEAGYGLGRSPQYGWEIPNYFQNFSISDTATYMWLSNEILRHHGSAATLVMPYTKAIYAYKKEASYNELKRAISFLTKAPLTDEHLMKARIISDNYLKDSLLSDSIAQLETVHFPNGYLSKWEAYKKIRSIYKPQEVEIAYTDFLKKYPSNETNKDLDKILGIEYGSLYRKLGMVYIAQQKINSALNLLPNEPFINIPELFYKIVEIPYADWKTMPADTAYIYAKPLMDRWNYFIKNKPAEYWYLTDDEWKNTTDQYGKRNYIIYADILMNKNNWEEAKLYAAKAQYCYQYKNAELNELQAKIFAHFKEEKNLDILLANSVKLNQATTEIISMMKDKYVAKHGSEKGFDAYFESLKDAKTLELIKEEVKKSSVNIPAYNFTMKDQLGKEITLEGLKGKTVVLDFWATWCAPCKASFPGMNLAKEYFKNDKNVVFFFVDTQERIDDYVAKTVAYVKSKGFDFHILYDKNGDVYTQYAKAIHTSGIPFKIIIDKEGNIRNSNVGYKGSPTGLRDEMIDMVKLAQQGGTK